MITIRANEEEYEFKYNLCENHFKQYREEKKIISDEYKCPACPFQKDKGRSFIACVGCIKEGCINDLDITTYGYRKCPDPLQKPITVNSLEALIAIPFIVFFIVSVIGFAMSGFMYYTRPVRIISMFLLVLGGITCLLSLTYVILVQVKTTMNIKKLTVYFISSCIVMIVTSLYFVIFSLVEVLMKSPRQLGKTHDKRLRGRIQKILQEAA